MSEIIIKPQGSHLDKSIGEEDGILKIPNNPPKYLKYKPTLIHLESTIPEISKNQSESTFKNFSMKDFTGKARKENFTLIMKPDELMLSSFQNLPKMNYFGVSKKPSFENFGDIIEYDFSFSFRNFFLFYTYHFLYYLFLGPAIYPILYFWKGKSILHNLSFTFWNYYCWTQAVEYLLILLSFILFLVVFPKGHMYGGEIYTIFISVLFWISALSIKYATMNKEKIKYLHTRNLTMNEILSESTICYKNNKIDLEKHIMKELFSVISRTDIDISLFQIKFILDLEGNLKEQLIENDKKLNGKHFYSETDKKYSGISLIKKIITLGFEDNFNSNMFKKISVCFSILISLIPFFYKFFDQKIYDMNGGEIFISLLLLVTNAVFYYKNMNFGLNILFEYKKLSVFLCQLSQLLSPKAVFYYSKKKIFPTLDIFSPTILESWDTLHKICRNFDKKLRFRIDCFMSVAIIFNLAGAILVIIVLLDHSNFFREFYVFSIFLNIIFAFIIACGLIRYGVIINNHYEIHKKIMVNNMKVYSDLNNHYCLYFDHEEGKYENELYKEASQRIKTYSYDYCIKTFINCTEEQFFKSLKKIRLNLLRNLRKIAKNMINDLDFQSKNDPFKIVGIPATSPILTSLIGIVVSFSIAILQLGIKTYFF